MLNWIFTDYNYGPVMRTAIVMFAFFVTNSCLADDWNIGIACNPSNSWLRIGDISDADWPKPSDSLQVINAPWPAFGSGPGMSRGGSPFRYPSKTTTYRCGRFAVKLRSEYFNQNPDGALGVYTFGSAQIYMGKKILLPKTGFFQCEENYPRYAYFGKCPMDFARTVIMSLDKNSNSVSVTVMRKYFDDASAEKESIDTYSVRNARP